MIIVPAIDLMAGKAVRLAQGRRDAVTTYHDRPSQLAVDFANAGAQLIHVVDLDGAFAGAPAQLHAIEVIAQEAARAGATIQAGGGIRDAQAVRAMLAAGVTRVVVGTLAVREPDLVASLCKAHPGAIVVAADSHQGKVATEGWTQSSDRTPRAIAEAAQRWGAAAVLHTEVSRDGMRGGAAIEQTLAVQNGLAIDVFASGGIGTLDDIAACKAAGIRGVVLGRALYEGVFTIEEALARC